jgi:hypothetical protein
VFDYPSRLSGYPVPYLLNIFNRKTFANPKTQSYCAHASTPRTTA